MSTIRTLNVLLKASTGGFKKSMADSASAARTFGVAVGGARNVIKGFESGGLTAARAAANLTRRLVSMRGASDPVKVSLAGLKPAALQVARGLGQMGAAAVRSAGHVADLARRAVVGAARLMGFGRSAHHAGKSLLGMVAATKRLVEASVVFKAIQFGIRELKSMAAEFKSVADNMEKVHNQAVRLNISTRILSGLDFAAKQSGVSVSIFSQSLDNMLQRIGMLASGVRTTSVHLSQFGLSAKKLASESPAVALREIVHALHHTGNAAERAALAQAIFGRGGLQMINVLGKGNKSLDAQIKLAKQLGVSFNAIQATKVEDANTALGKMQAVWTGLKQTLIIQLAPMVTALGNKFANLSKSGVNMSASVGKGLMWVAHIFGIIMDAGRAVRAIWYTLESAVNAIIGTIIQGIAKLSHVLDYIEHKKPSKNFMDYWAQAMAEQQKTLHTQRNNAWSNFMKNPGKWENKLPRWMQNLQTAANAKPTKPLLANTPFVVPPKVIKPHKVAHHPLHHAVHHAIHHAARTVEHHVAAQVVLGRGQLGGVDPAVKANTQRNSIIDLLGQIHGVLANGVKLAEAAI